MTDLDIWKLRNEATLSAFVASWGLFRGSSSQHTRTVLTYCWTRSKTTFIASDPQKGRKRSIPHGPCACAQSSWCALTGHIGQICLTRGGPN